MTWKVFAIVVGHIGGQDPLSFPGEALVRCSELGRLRKWRRRRAAASARWLPNTSPPKHGCLPPPTPRANYHSQPYEKFVCQNGWLQWQQLPGCPQTTEEYRKFIIGDAVLRCWWHLWRCSRGIHFLGYHWTRNGFVDDSGWRQCETCSKIRNGSVLTRENRKTLHV